MEQLESCKQSSLTSIWVKARPYVASLVVLACVFPLFKFEYSTDTYHFALADNLNGIIGAMKYNGRIIIMLGAMLLQALSVSFIGFYYVSFLMSILFATLSITTLYKMLKGHITRNLAFFLAIITVFNPFSFEHFLFIEKGFFAFAIFMAILSAKFFLKFLQGNLWCLILSYVFLSLCAFTYQALPATFVSLAVLFIAIYSKSIKTFFINSILAVSIYGFSTFMIFILMKALKLTERAGNGFQISNVYKFITFGLAKPYMLLVYVAIFAILFAVIFVSSKKKTGKFFTKSSVLTFFKYSFIITCTVLATSAPCPFSRAEDVWFTFRFAYPIGMLCGTIPMLHFFKIEKAQDAPTALFSRATRKGSIIMIVILLIFMALFHSFYFSRHITNAKDIRDAEKIGDAIEKYEEETGITIKNISIYYDSNHSDSHPFAVSMPNCNVRALSRSWCDVAHLSLFHDRSYNKVDNNGDYKKYFSSNDWGEINDELFIFDGDTLHLCVY